MSKPVIVNGVKYYLVKQTKLELDYSMCCGCVFESIQTNDCEYDECLGKYDTVYKRYDAPIVRKKKIKEIFNEKI